MKLQVLCAGLVVLVGCAGDVPLGDVAAEARSGDSHGKSPTAQACDPSMFVTTANIPACCQDGNRVWYVAIPPGESERSLFFRDLLTPCSMEDGSTQCGRDLGIPCQAGP